MKRFYPDSLPAFEHEPSKEKFMVRKISPSVGEGVVALTSFKKDQVVCGFTGYVVNVITQYSLTMSPGVHVHDPYFMGKILHSCDPNLSCDMECRIFTALKDIHPGEIITMDYAQTEDELFKPFECSCGAANCRGYVAGRLDSAVAGHFL